MSEIKDGGPAFPSRGGMMFYVPESAQGHVSEAVSALDKQHEGLTMRDYFAAKAMQALISIENDGSEGWPYTRLAGLALNSYTFADAMLKARKK